MMPKYIMPAHILPHMHNDLIVCHIGLIGRQEESALQAVLHDRLACAGKTVLICGDFHEDNEALLAKHKAMTIAAPADILDLQSMLELKARSVGLTERNARGITELTLTANDNFDYNVKTITKYDHERKRKGHERPYKFHR
jgi:hypothetical protein